MQTTLQELAQLTNSGLVGDPLHPITGVEDLASATPEEISFLANPLYRQLLETTQAGAVCIDSKTALIPGKNYLVSDNPSATFQTIVGLFLPPIPSGFTGIHSTAVIHPSVKIGSDVTIGPYTVIDQGCTIGDRTCIGYGVAIGPGVQIGADCQIHAHVILREGSLLGNRVIIQPGAVIGSCGFGYTTDDQGLHNKQPQLGIVILEDDVEIGANTTIDRARFKTTRICHGTKIDNLVQIAHNCSIGPHNIIVSQTGIAGSVKTGHHVIMGGQTGTVGHIEIADGAMFAARSGIKKSIRQAGKYGGNPATSLNDHNREQAFLRKLKHKIAALEDRLKSN